MQRIAFLIPGKPMGKARPRFYRGRAVTPEETREYESLTAILYLCAARDKKFEDKQPLRLFIDAYYPIPKSISKKRRAEIENGCVLPSCKPDIDNVVKIILDALNGVAYHDDSQVVEIHAAKHYADDPKVSVIVESVS